MSTPVERSNRPYSPESAGSRQEIYTVKEQLWVLEEKIRDARADPSERYDNLKQACFLIYGLFGGLWPRLSDEERADIEGIYAAVTNDTVPEPPQIRTEPLQFRQGHAQYDLLVGDVSVAQCFDEQLDTVSQKIILEPLAKAHAKAGVQRLFPQWARLHWYLAKHKQWDIDTRIFKAETGYNTAQKRERFAQLTGLGAPAGLTREKSDGD